MRAEVAIVGNGVAGYACAARLARHGIRPLLIGRGLPVDRPPLSKTAIVKGEPALLADAERLAERGIDVLEGMVDEADLAERRLTVGEMELDADAIVLATGLSYRPPPIPGLDVAHVNATPGGCRRLIAALGDGPPRATTVIGGGLVGVETAFTLAGLGHDVTVVDVLERPVDRLHDPIPAIVGGWLDEAGISFVGASPVTEVVSGSDSAQVTVCYEGGSTAAELVVAATGGRRVAPPGLELGGGPIEVGHDFAVPGHRGVYAVGDLVTIPHSRFGPIVFPQWDGAIGTGEAAADAIAGVVAPYERLPYWWSDLGTHRLAEVGWAGAVAAWGIEDGLHVGRASDGAVAAVLVVDEPRRLRDARTLVTAVG